MSTKNKKNYKEYYDKETDILWRVLKPGPEEYYEEVGPDIKLEYGENSELIGIEVWNYSKKIQSVSRPKNTGVKYSSYIISGSSPDNFVFNFNSL